jgi:hypothetical protein
LTIFLSRVSIRSDSEAHPSFELPTSSVHRMLPSIAASLAIVLLHFGSVVGTALTTSIAPNEKQCFFADVDKAFEKIGVCPLSFSLYPVLTRDIVLLRCMSPSHPLHLPPANREQVQSGGSFDISFTISSPGPTPRVLLSGSKERQGDYVLTANTPGEYSFCFENDVGTLADKLVDFDIMVESEPRRAISAKPGQIAEQTSALEESILRLNGMMHNIRRTQR